MDSNIQTVFDIPNTIVTNSIADYRGHASHSMIFRAINFVLPTSKSAITFLTTSRALKDPERKAIVQRIA